jgi:hypothetical protein
MGDVTLSPLAAAHLAYHLRMAASFAAAGNLMESASEAALGWTILHLQGDASDVVLEHDLPAFGVARASDDAWHAVQRRAQALALELQAHFVSEEQHDAASMYEAVGSALTVAMPRLRPRA